jgi:hypothetical protein
MSTFLKSTLITNRDAVPKVLTDGLLAGGEVTQTIGSVLTGSSDPAGTYYRLVSVPSNARLTQLWWQAQALSNSCILDVAVLYPEAIPQGGANFIPSACAGILISSSIFAAGLTAGLSNALTDITNNSGNYSIPLQETPLWNVLGIFTADPEIPFDLGFSVRVTNSASGYVGLKCAYQY